jgi:hypothetical protein
MATCEDFPCCGHERGCCPDYDPETGAQLNMVCVCGAKLPINARYSICAGCMRDPDDPDQDRYYDYHDELDGEDDSDLSCDDEEECDAY